MLLVSALARQEEVKLVHCDTCDGAMLVTLLRKPRRVCAHCAQRSQRLFDRDDAQRNPVEGGDSQESARETRVQSFAVVRRGLPP